MNTGTPCCTSNLSKSTMVKQAIGDFWGGGVDNRGGAVIYV